MNSVYRAITEPKRKVKKLASESDFELVGLIRAGSAILESGEGSRSEEKGLVIEQLIIRLSKKKLL